MISTRMVQLGYIFVKIISLLVFALGSGEFKISSQTRFFNLFNSICKNIKTTDRFATYVTKTHTKF